MVNGRFVVPVKSHFLKDLPGVYMNGQYVSKYNVTTVVEPKRRIGSHLLSVERDTSGYKGFQPMSTISSKAGLHNPTASRSYANSYIEDQFQTNRLGLPPTSLINTNNSFLKRN